MTVRDKHKLVTSGPYAVVRHPAYTGLAVQAIGMTLYQLGHGSWWMEAGRSTSIGTILGVGYAVITVFEIAVVSRCVPEDEFLKKEFGEEWNMWAKKVPSLLVPGIY